MTQYINKVAVIAEIERRISEVEQIDKASYEVGLLDAYKIIRSFLDTLEVKDDFVSNDTISKDLEEAARKIGQKYFPNENCIWARPNYEAMAAENAFKAGAQWQKEQDQSTIELAEDHAYLAGQEKVIEKACEFIETYPHLFMGVLRSEVIEDFKNYMKGG